MVNEIKTNELTNAAVSPDVETGSGLVFLESDSVEVKVLKVLRFHTPQLIQANTSSLRLVKYDDLGCSGCNWVRSDSTSPHLHVEHVVEVLTENDLLK